MIVIGLTGSIGMGKSTVAKMFAEEGARVFDSDAAVHKLYAKGGAAVAAVGAEFPAAVSEGAIDRALLSPLVLDNPAALKRLEQIVHPLVRQAQVEFSEAERARRRGGGVRYPAAAGRKTPICSIRLSSFPPRRPCSARVLARPA